MSGFDKCKDRHYHVLEFIQDHAESNEFRVIGNLECKDCGANTSSVNEILFIGGKEIEGLVFKEEESERRKEYRESV